MSRGSHRKYTRSHSNSFQLRHYCSFLGFGLNILSLKVCLFFLIVKANIYALGGRYETETIKETAEGAS